MKLWEPCTSVTQVTSFSRSRNHHQRTQQCVLLKPAEPMIKDSQIVLLSETKSGRTLQFVCLFTESYAMNTS